jgi:hypothetical protein
MIGRSCAFIERSFSEWQGGARRCARIAGNSGPREMFQSKRAPLRSASGEGRRLPWVLSAPAYLPMGFSK